VAGAPDPQTLVTVPLPAWRRVARADFGPGVALAVGGTDVWFASRDADLCPSAAAAVCLLAPWAALHALPVPAPGEPLDGRFIAGVASATALMGGWWGHGPLQWSSPPTKQAPIDAAVPANAALFFSGGIDSFHSLFRAGGIDCLVNLAGFDVRLARRDVWSSQLASHRAVASARSLRLVHVATNVRDHPVLGRMRWARYHGAVLAATAHLLQNEASRFLVSASYHQSNLMPWGSHPALDPLWSSSRVAIEHFGVDLWRAEKLAGLRDEPLVHRHLRVCYDNPGPAQDCGRCEKCVRTRLVYLLDLPGCASAGLPGPDRLPDDLDALPPLAMRSLVRIYQRFLARAEAGSPVQAALERLILRSQS
jgi:hypothetical protein